MNMNSGYQMYQAERGKSPAEQLYADRQAGQRAAAVTRGWRALLIRHQIHPIETQEICHQVAG
jgi:hypothetical protein